MRFHFHRQEDAVDCGAACLQMICDYYGHYYNLETLRQMISVDVGGVSLARISRAAENLGLHTIGGRVSFETLVQKALLPCVVYWEQYHFVVIYKISKRRGKWVIYVADPGCGQIQYSEEEFCKHWICSRNNDEDKGIILLFEPSGKFKTITPEQTLEAKNKVAFLFSYFFRYRHYFFQISIGLFAACFVQLLFPFLTQSVVDIGIDNADKHFIWIILSAQLMLILGETVIGFIRRKLLLYISSHINLSVISDYLIKLMKLPMKFFDAKHYGDLLQRIEDHKRVEEFISVQTMNTLFSLFTIIVFSIVLIIYNKSIFYIFLVSSIIYFLWKTVFLSKRRMLDYKLFEQDAQEQSVTMQLITGMQEIKLQNYETKKRWEWEDVQASKYEVSLQALTLQQEQEAGGVFIREIKDIIITAITAFSVINGAMTLGMMLAVQYIIGQLNNPVEQIMDFIYKWQDVSISLDRMYEIRTREDENGPTRNKSSLNNMDKSIVFENVSFQYNDEDNPIVLNNICLTIPQNKVTAIVGDSGSGKTTLIKLILGYYPPTYGRIRIGGIDLQDLNLSWWRGRCGAVMQEGFIFSDTIANNIRLSSEYNKEELIQAMKLSNVKEFVDGLPLGINTKIGQDGQSLSQGQKQRILIARAVYKSPDFLFLDEATNALDANNERLILENLNSIYEGKTVLVIAHRLSTVKNSDNIVVLKGGAIAEQGSHKSLLMKKGAYYELVKNQLELE